MELGLGCQSVIKSQQPNNEAQETSIGVATDSVGIFVALRTDQSDLECLCVGRLEDALLCL